jgi:hypothetical protein
MQVLRHQTPQPGYFASGVALSSINTFCSTPTLKTSQMDTQQTAHHRPTGQDDRLPKATSAPCRELRNTTHEFPQSHAIPYTANHAFPLPLQNVSVSIDDRYVSKLAKLATFRKQNAADGRVATAITYLDYPAAPERRASSSRSPSSPTAASPAVP